MNLFRVVYRDAGDLETPLYGPVPSERPHWTSVLLFGAIYVYLLQRTYPPGS